MGCGMPKSIKQELEEQNVIITITVQPDGRFTFHCNKDLTDDQYRTIFLEAIISTVMSGQVMQ